MARDTIPKFHGSVVSDGKRSKNIYKNRREREWNGKEKLVALHRQTENTCEKKR